MYKPTSHGATRTTCDRCGADVYQQKTGLPFVVTADTEKLAPDAAAKLTGPNRLAWCLRETRWSGARLAEVLGPFHNRACTWAHVVDHICPPGMPLKKGALW